MVPFLDDVRRLLQHDIDPDFLEALAKAIAWKYSTLHDELLLEVGLSDQCREEEFNKRRGDAVRNAMAEVATRFGVPFDLRKLSANGQHKILVRAGRVVLVQEAILAHDDQPNASDYKKGLAATHGFVRQLEFDFGDRLQPPSDWSGCVLAALLHGPTSTKFSREGKELGNLMLAVPDSAYQQWITRLDLYTLAMHGRGAAEEGQRSGASEPDVQTDDVTVRRKRLNRARDTA